MSENKSSGVEDKIFEEFLVQLTTKGINDDIVSRLRKLLLEDRNITETAIKAIILPDDQTQ